jgi:hypothetical protein
MACALSGQLVPLVTHLNLHGGCFGLLPSATGTIDRLCPSDGSLCRLLLLHATKLLTTVPEWFYNRDCTLHGVDIVVTTICCHIGMPWIPCIMGGCMLATALLCTPHAVCKVTSLARCYATDMFMSILLHSCAAVPCSQQHHDGCCARLCTAMHTRSGTCAVPVSLVLQQCGRPRKNPSSSGCHRLRVLHPKSSGRLVRWGMPALNCY